MVDRLSTPARFSTPARLAWIAAALLLAPCAIHAQDTHATLDPKPPAIPAAADPARPLPDVVSLMRQVELNERTAEAVEKNYTYTTSSKLVEYNGSGAVKKTETRVFEISWIDGVRQAREISKDGKPLSADELRKEDDRHADAVTKAKERRAKADAEGKETDSRGRDEITLSRMLELGAFSNPRRVQINGRDTIAIDFTGDPKAKIHNPGENAVREMAGTVWVDETDKAIEHLEGRFNNAFKMGGGLLMNVAQGTSFRIQNVHLNGEVWLPQTFEAHGHARVLLFVSFDGDLTAHMSDYRRFRTSTTILPGLQKVDPDPDPSSAPALPSTPLPPQP